MDISREQLDEALHHVQQGLLQPEEAARWLMGQLDSAAQGLPALTASPPAVTLRSVATLQRSLGPPPLEIQQDWDEQLLTLADGFERAHRRTLPELTADDLLVDLNNRLSLSPRFLAAVALSPVRPPSVADETVEPLAPGIDPPHPTTHQRHAVRQRRRQKGKRRFIARHRWLIATGVIAAAAITLGLTTDALTSRDAVRSANTVGPKRPSRGSSIFSPHAVSDQAMTSTQPAINPLDDGSDSADRLSTATLGLNTFAGADWVSSTELLPSADFGRDRTTPPVASLSAIQSSSEPAVMSRADDELRMATNQEDLNEVVNDSPTTQTRSATSFELPPMPSLAPARAPESPVVVIDQSVRDLTLRFPVETGLSLVRKGRQWAVHAVKDQAELANFIAGEDDLQFRWTDLASSNPAAKQLISGALTYTLADGSMRSLYLRPEVTADALPIDLSNAETTAAWPIMLAPPSGPSALTIQFHLPPGLLQTWIQPHDPKQFRRAQSLAEFTLDSDPTIAIRTRLDLRIGNRITVRMRYAAQLDPSFPWQLISTNRIQSASTHVTEQLARALADQSHLKTAYARASPSEKQLLGSRRDAMDAFITQLQAIVARLAKYEQLIGQLDGGARLTMHLEVAWPESMPLTNQRIFALLMPVTDPP